MAGASVQRLEITSEEGMARTGAPGGRRATRGIGYVVKVPGQTLRWPVQQGVTGMM